MTSPYDNFAKEYSEAMGEEGDFFHKTQIDPYIYKIVGAIKGKKVYDFGCGNGYMARYLYKNGATVIASDSSSELITLAKEKSVGMDITYSVEPITDKQFDVVIMNMVIHYLDDLDKIFQDVSKILKPGGTLVFSTNHFFRPPHPYSEWVKGKIGDEEKLFIKVTNYLKTYSVDTLSPWDHKTKLTIINRPLNSYINTAAKYGLFLKELHEPESKGFAKDFSEALQQSHHIPTYVILGFQKI